MLISKKGPHTRIQWTDETWNPTTGCTKVSAGCKNCYADPIAKRLQERGVPKYRNGFKLTLHPYALKIPYRWREPRRVFVNSMSDLFHEEVPFHFIEQVFDVMCDLQQHQYQILTKRASRLADLSALLPWAENIWMGVSVEDIRVVDRIDLLRSTDAHIKFLSLEPLLGPLPALNLDSIDWVIIGGESGQKARRCEISWFEEIIDQCDARGMPVFVKQLGTALYREFGMKDWKGGDYDKFPPKLQRREYPR